jgi:hypothetical protein
MRITQLAIAILVAAVAWLLVGELRRPPDRLDRGPDGIDFTIPGAYLRLDLGEADLPRASAALLDTLDAAPQVAAEYTEAGDRVQLLIDVPGNTIDERVYGRNGTVRRTTWSRGIRERLQHAVEHGTLAVPGLPAPESRNPYH